MRCFFRLINARVCVVVSQPMIVLIIIGKRAQDGLGEGDTGSKFGARLLAGSMTKNGSFAEAAYNFTGESVTGGLTVTYGFRF